MELMEGLALLSSEVRSIPAPLFYILTVICAVMFVIGLYFIFKTISDGDYLATFFFVILSGCVLICGAMTWSIANITPKTYYKVTIDESVSMVEFYERYEIISQEGLIFTITEKEVS